MARAAWAVVGSVLGLLVACSSSDDGGSASPDAACTNLTATLCAKVKTCFPDLYPALYTDDATCQARAKISCLNTVNAKGTAITSADLDACSSALNGLSDCNQALDFDRNPPEACKPKAGAGAAGAACQDSSQCSTKYCKLGTASACGACAARAGAGAHCDVGDDCEYGLDCGGNNTCVAPGAAGESCSNDKPCKAGLVCKTGTAGSASGTCSAPSNAGEACTGDECDSSKGLFCNPSSKTCQKVTFASAGGACGFTGGNITLCQGSGSNCNVAAGTETGTCQAALADGAACGTTATASCQEPARCVNNVCTLPTSCGG